MTVTWADIQEWRSDYVNEAQQTIEDALRTARGIVDDLEYAANDIRSEGQGPDQMRQQLSDIQDRLDSRINETHRICAGDCGAARVRESRRRKEGVRVGGCGRSWV